MDEYRAGRYALLMQLLTMLPDSGKWTSRERAKWLKAFTANLDMLVSIEIPVKGAQEAR